MTLTEFSNEFDVLYNNISSNQAPGLNEYEKSVFLTKAQSEIIKNYFNPKGNKYEEGFDDSAKRQVDFSNIIKTTNLSSNTDASISKLDKRSTVYSFPKDCLMVLNETLYLTSLTNGKTSLVTIIPLSYVEYARLMSKPYKYPLKNQAWKLITNNGDDTTDTDGTVVEIITPSNYNSYEQEYQCRYVRRPSPIVLINLNDDEYEGLSIEGIDTSSECELDESLHQEILQRAVELAKAAYAGDINTAVELGKRSE